MKPYTAIQEDLTLKKYRVDLHTSLILKDNFKVRRYVEVEAVNIGKAIIAALNIVGFTCFPNDWKNIRVKKLSLENQGFESEKEEFEFLDSNTNNQFETKEKKKNFFGKIFG